jgi:hypothetical protein
MTMIRVVRESTNVDNAIRAPPKGGIKGSVKLTIDFKVSGDTVEIESIMRDIETAARNQHLFPD